MDCGLCYKICPQWWPQPESKPANREETSSTYEQYEEVIHESEEEPFERRGLVLAVQKKRDVQQQTDFCQPSLPVLARTLAYQQAYEPRPWRYAQQHTDLYTLPIPFSARTFANRDQQMYEQRLWRYAPRQEDLFFPRDQQMYEPGLWKYAPQPIYENVDILADRDQQLYDPRLRRYSHQQTDLCMPTQPLSACTHAASEPRLNAPEPIYENFGIIQPKHQQQQTLYQQVNTHPPQAADLPKVVVSPPSVPNSPPILDPPPTFEDQHCPHLLSAFYKPTGQPESALENDVNNFTDICFQCNIPNTNSIEFRF